MDFLFSPSFVINVRYFKDAQGLSCFDLYQDLVRLIYLKEIKLYKAIVLFNDFIFDTYDEGKTKAAQEISRFTPQVHVKSLQVDVGAIVNLLRLSATFSFAAIIKPALVLLVLFACSGSVLV